FTAFLLPVVRDDPGPITGRRIALGLRRIERHDDGGGHTERARRTGNGLTVIARRKRHDTGAALGVVEPRNGVAGAPILERPHTLKVLTLEIDLGIEAAVQGL